MAFWLQSIPSGMHHTQLLMSLRDREKAASAGGAPAVKVSFFPLLIHHMCIKQMLYLPVS